MWIGAGVAAVFVVLAAMAIVSHLTDGPPAFSGELRPCGSAPNCVCSEFDAAGDPEHVIEPLNIEGDSKAFWQSLVEAVQVLGGTIVSNERGYLHATFTTPLLRFKDDFEARVDGTRIQLRSASRVGYSDFGANRRRVMAIERAMSSAKEQRQ
jgi:uncharacterized protein (DUF1499 family)